MTMYKWFFFWLVMKQFKKQIFQAKDKCLMHSMAIWWVQHSFNLHYSTGDIPVKFLFCSAATAKLLCASLHLCFKETPPCVLVFWRLVFAKPQNCLSIIKSKSKGYINFKLVWMWYNWLVIILKLKTLEFGKSLTIWMYAFFFAQRPF